MKNFAAILVFVLALAAQIFAQPKTVTDFYLAFPAGVYDRDASGEKIKSKKDLIEFRKSLIKVEDIKNGYLKLEGPWEGWAEIALFKKTDGSYIVAHVETGCGPACGGSYWFRTYKGGVWKDVTAAVFPKVSDAQAAAAFNKMKPSDADAASVKDGMPWYLVLPQKGTTVFAACNECAESDSGNFMFMTFEWNGVKFTKSK